MSALDELIDAFDVELSLSYFYLLATPTVGVEGLVLFYLLADCEVRKAGLMFFTHLSTLYKSKYMKIFERHYLCIGHL